MKNLKISLGNWKSFLNQQPTSFITRGQKILLRSFTNNEIITKIRKIDSALKNILLRQYDLIKVNILLL